MKEVRWLVGREMNIKFNDNVFRKNKNVIKVFFLVLRKNICHALGNQLRWTC